MINYRLRNSGVTLIELLVVLSIIMIMVTMVGGNTLDSVRKARAQTEIVSIYSLVRKASTHAFASGKDVTLEFSNQNLTLSIGNEVIKRENLIFLQFPTQTIGFDRNGMPDTLSVEAETRGQDKILDFGSIFTSRIKHAE